MTMRLPRIPNPLRLLSRDVDEDDAREFQVRIEFDLGRPLSREELEEAAARAVEALEHRTPAIALGPVAACDFTTGEIDLEFTVLARRSSELHAKIGQAVRAIESTFPSVRERASDTRVTQPARPAAVPA